MEGKGFLSFEDQCCLDGYWKDNEFIKGRYVMADGATMTGQYANGAANGPVVFKSSTWSYEGDMVDGWPQGKGRFVWQTPQKFEIVYSGTIDSGLLKVGKLIITSIANRNFVLQTVEGLFDVPISKTPFEPKQKVAASEEVAAKKEEPVVEESKEVPKEDGPIETKSAPVEASPVNTANDSEVAELQAKLASMKDQAHKEQQAQQTKHDQALAAEKAKVQAEVERLVSEAKAA